MTTKKVLNVGGGSNRTLSDFYKGWTQEVLDIDPKVNPDICCDARELHLMTEYYNSYDGIVCSHNLEHYYKHEVPVVLDGFNRVLKESGTVEIHVPNVKGLMQAVMQQNLDLDDVWYRTGDNSPITFHDVLYGWNIAMSQGNLFYSHKCGFTMLSLTTTMLRAGFTIVQANETLTDLTVIAQKPCLEK